MQTIPKFSETIWKARLLLVVSRKDGMAEMQSVGHCVKMQRTAEIHRMADGGGYKFHSEISLDPRLVIIITTNHMSETKADWLRCIYDMELTVKTSTWEVPLNSKWVTASKLPLPQLTWYGFDVAVSKLDMNLPSSAN